MTEVQDVLQSEIIAVSHLCEPPAVEFYWSLLLMHWLYVYVPFSSFLTGKGGSQFVHSVQ